MYAELLFCYQIETASSDGGTSAFGDIDLGELASSSEFEWRASSNLRAFVQIAAEEARDLKMVSSSVCIFLTFALIIPSTSDSLAMPPMRMPAMRAIDTLGSTLEDSLTRLPLREWLSRISLDQPVTVGVDWESVPHAMDPRSTTVRAIWVRKSFGSAYDKQRVSSHPPPTGSGGRTGRTRAAVS